MSYTDGTPRKWVSAKFLASYYEVTPKTIWEWARKKRIPAPQKIGPNCTRWNFDEIRAQEEAA